MRNSFPDEIGIALSYDYSEYISNELDKIFFRTILCLVILLLFAFAVNRSWRYMMVIALTLVVNLSISVALYYLLGLHIHIYTLAGVTVSLGIIIDNSIVMIDHYSRHRDRSVFPALLSAVLTTVSALLVSLLFVPALLDYFPVRYSQGARKSRRLRKVVKWNRFYAKYISWGTAHRWALVLVLIAAFGIPTCLIPQEFGNENQAPLKEHQKILNNIVNWRSYARNRKQIDNILGTSFALFRKAMSRSDFYREPSRQTLTIRAGMPEGCTLHQLNYVMQSMENYLANFDAIEVFETRITSYRDGRITVNFKPEYESSSQLLDIKRDIILMAQNFGGANWSVSGIDDKYFNNNILSEYRFNQITRTGYNYEQLYSYAQQLVNHLLINQRVSKPEIWGIGSNDRPLTEFNLQYDFGRLGSLGVRPDSYHGALQSPLYSSVVTRVPGLDGYVNVRLESSSKDDFDIWHVSNQGVVVGDHTMKLSEVGSISKEKTGLPIQKRDQSYILVVCFDFVGSSQLAERAIDEAVLYMNKEVLPIGFVASVNSPGWFYDNQDKYAGLILLVIAIIFVICAIHLNSLRLSLAIVLMIPFSFVGLFLAFGLTNFTFDKGGFAAFVMLSGITVNAGIYLVSVWLNEKGGQTVKSYTRAFNRKIWPISLTILSTILGLVPFLFDGPDEVFWFGFAIGTIAGLVFSVIALVFFLPALACRRRHSNSVE